MINLTVRVQLKTTESSLASSNRKQYTSSYEWFIKFLEWTRGAGFSPAYKKNSENSSVDLADLCHSEEFEKSGNFHNCQLHHLLCHNPHQQNGYPKSYLLPPRGFYCSWHQTLPWPDLLAKARKTVEAGSPPHGVHIHLPNLASG